MSVLQVDDVSSGYGDSLVVDRVDLRVDDGKVVTIIGPNGAGKSTLVKTIVGILPARTGRVVVDGEDITGVQPERMSDHGICYVPQRNNVFPSLTVVENLKMGAWTRPDEFAERAGEVYDVFPVLSENRRERVATLSAGQQKMVAIGAALMVDPDLLILDEPSSGLAPGLIDETFGKVADINDQGKTVLMVEQNARRALEESDRGVVMSGGRTRVAGESEDLLASEEVAELYLGD